MIVSFHPAYEGDRNVICAGRAPNAGDRALIRRARAVILSQGCRRQLYELARANCRNVFPNYDLRFKYPGKLGQVRLFRKFDAAHPASELFDSVASYRRRRETAGSQPSFGFPFVFKFDWGGEGQTVFLIRTTADMKALLEKASTFEATGQKGFLLQEYVASGDRSLRVVVIGKRTLTYWRIQPEGGDFRSSVSCGATIDPDSDPEHRQRGAERVRAFCRRTGIDLAGFDVLFPTLSGLRDPLMLELNYFFGRRGLGGSLEFYRILEAEIQDWLRERGLK
jgi:ribosomal protein S6--L-glutamate ligase